MLWCRISRVPATETDKECALITDKQAKPRIADSGQEAEKRRVELVDAKQSSSVAGKQHMMGDTTGGERDGTWSRVHTVRCSLHGFTGYVVCGHGFTQGASDEVLGGEARVR